MADNAVCHCLAPRSPSRSEHGALSFRSHFQIHRPTCLGTVQNPTPAQVLGVLDTGSSPATFFLLFIYLYFCGKESWGSPLRCAGSESSLSFDSLILSVFLRAPPPLECWGPPNSWILFALASELLRRTYFLVQLSNCSSICFGLAFSWALKKKDLKPLQSSSYA